MQSVLRNYPNLQLLEASVEDLLVDEGSDGSAAVRGLVTQSGNSDKQILATSISFSNGIIGQEVICPRVVITTGTFLRGKVYLGQDWYYAGRHQRNAQNDIEPPSIGLAQTLER